jgi:hypothetical protein
MRPSEADKIYWRYRRFSLILAIGVMVDGSYNRTRWVPRLATPSMPGPNMKVPSVSEHYFISGVLRVAKRVTTPLHL